MCKSDPQSSFPIPPANLLTVSSINIGFTDSILRQTSQIVNFSNVDVLSIINAMRQVMYHINYAAGISAIQIGIPLRISIVNISRSPSKEIVLINPIVISISGRFVKRSEGCLSLPNFKGFVARKNNIEIEACTQHGDKFRHKATGYESAVIQHELDHLDGIFYWDRMKDTAKPERVMHKGQK